MPARYWAVRRALRELGVKLEERGAKGSHVVVRDSRGRTYTIPLHHGEKTELADVYLRGICRALELDYDRFRKLL